MSSHSGEPDHVPMASRRAALSAAGALLLAPAAWAQNAIQSITSSQQAGTEVVRIELSEALASVPNGFSVQAPPRIAIDLPGVGNALGRNTVESQPGQPAFGGRGPRRVIARAWS
jgi:hypothetical protein